MNVSEPLALDLKAIENQVTEYQFELNDAFFASLEGAMVQQGDVRARVQVRKLSSHFELHLAVEGYVQVACDRCLEPMRQPVENESRLSVKFGEAYEEVNDELVVIPQVPGRLDLTWYLYELTVLAIPIRHVHEEGACNADMAARLESLSAGRQATDDPRWEALKNLRNN